MLANRTYCVMPSHFILIVFTFGVVFVAINASARVDKQLNRVWLPSVPTWCLIN